MNREMQCPYCSAWQNACSDNREPNEHYEHTCIFCEKIFGYAIDYIPCYTTYTCPCANGEPHDWKEINGHPEQYYHQILRCSYCQEETTIKALRLQELNK